MMRSNWSELNNLIHNSEKIGVVSHINPDGDNLGSLLGLGLSLKSLNKDVYLIKADFIPNDYKTLSGIELLDDFHGDYLDLLFVLDCSDPDRLGHNKFLMDKSKSIVNIDHHISNTNYGEFNFVDTTASSTGEMIYELLIELKLPINREIAENLYVAISTDTGRFSYESVTGLTHKVISELYKYNINAYHINKVLYQSRSIQRTKLFIDAISKLNFYYDTTVAIVKVTHNMLKDSDAKMEDTEGIVEFLRDTDSVEVACLLKEMSSEEIKVSIRTKSNINANEICSAFGGGGHIRASGCSIKADIHMAEKLIINEIAKYLE